MNFAVNSGTTPTPVDGYLRTAAGHTIAPASQSSLATARRVLFMGEDYEADAAARNAACAMLHRPDTAPGECADRIDGRISRQGAAALHVDSLSTTLAGCWQIQLVVRHSSYKSLI